MAKSPMSYMEEARARKKKMSSALIKIMKYICLHCCAGSQD